MEILFKADFPDLMMYHVVEEHPDAKLFRPHVHNQHEIYLFLGGAASYLVEGHEYPLTPGSLLIMRAAESHAVKILQDKPYERITLNFSSSVLDAVDPAHRLLAPFLDRPLGAGNLYTPHDLGGDGAATRMRAMSSDGRDAYRQRLTVLVHFFPLLHDISRAFVSRSDPHLPEQSAAAQILVFVNEHLFDPLTVSGIAQHFFLSVSQLERIFRQATRSSVWQYITAKRLIAAKARIAAGTPAREACEECCFGDYSAFYRAYVKAYGVSPKQ